MDDSEVALGHASPVAVGSFFHRRPDTLPGLPDHDHPDTKGCMRSLLFSPSSASSCSPFSSCSVLSPVTNLAFNMDNMLGLGG